MKAERRAGLEGLLSPEELEEFDLETSHAAELARSRLEGFDATDQEHRALYRLFAATEALSSVDRAGEEVLEQQISEVLGGERYAQLKSSRTPEFQRFARIVEESGLPRDRAAEAYQICEALKEEAERLEADPELSEAERREALTALGGETEQALLETLGKAGLEKLKSSGAALPPSAGRRAKVAR